MVRIPARLVKQLREMTGARMMDCKQALIESQGDIEGAIARLRQKNEIVAQTLCDNEASEGIVESYIHSDKRIGVLIEVNCQTDFVARSQPFQDLVKNLAMQIAAFPVKYISIEEIPADIIEREREVELGREDLARKPESVRKEIVAGRVAKRLKTMALLPQPYIRDPKVTVQDLLEHHSATMGEKLRIKRFACFSLG